MYLLVLQVYSHVKQVIFRTFDIQLNLYLLKARGQYDGKHLLEMPNDSIVSEGNLKTNKQGICL